MRVMRVSIALFALIAHFIACHAQPGTPLTQYAADDAFGRLSCWDVVSRFLPGQRTYVGSAFAIDVVSGALVPCEVPVDLLAGQFVFTGGPSLDVTAAASTGWGGYGLRVLLIGCQLRDGDAGGQLFFAQDAASATTLTIAVSFDTFGNTYASVQAGNSISYAQARVLVPAAALGASIVLVTYVDWQAGYAVIQPPKTAGSGWRQWLRWLGAARAGTGSQSSKRRGGGQRASPSPFMIIV